jgi:NADH-quinone oxidoreductase subunit M
MPMHVLDNHLLSVVTFFPLFGALLLYVVPATSKQNTQRLRYVALLTTGVTFLLSLLVYSKFNSASGAMQLVEQERWIPSYGAAYALGVDGISLFLALLTTFLMLVVMITSPSVHHRVRGYLGTMLILETAILGTLFALDVLLFYVFWELMLAPMYFIIGIWGGKRRIYATLKFVLYTVAGSVLMLVAILFVVWRYQEQHHELTFLLSSLIGGTRLSFSEELWLFGAFALAFGIKVPIFPLHTWLPDAHVEAPTGGSVILAGVLLKMGLYGFLRFAYPLFPRAAEWFGPYLAVLGVIGIVYGALLAWAQTDIKKLVAYSSVSHLGYCVLGVAALNSIATTGSLYQMLSHGLSTGALFLIVGVLYDRKHTRAIADYQGLASKVPNFAALFLIFTLASIALPLTTGFVGEFLILIGSFGTYKTATSVAVLGVILGAIYMLSLYRRTAFGELDEEKNGDLVDLTAREKWALVPLAVLVFLLGVFPRVILNGMQPSVNTLIATVQSAKQVRAQVVQTSDGVSKSEESVLPIAWRIR